MSNAYHCDADGCTTASPLNSSEIEGIRQILEERGWLRQSIEERFRNDRDVQIDALARDLSRLTGGWTDLEGAVILYQSGWRKGDLPTEAVER
jgi:hypothetical protein